MIGNSVTKRSVRHLNLPVMTPGCHRTITVHHYGAENARPKVYLQAGLHGNEHAGIVVLYHLLRSLDTFAENNAIKGQVIVVPLVNPVGVSQFINGELVGRFELFSGTNFNRNFPDLTDAVSERVGDLLVNDPEINITLIRNAILAELRSFKEQGEASELRRLITLMAADADIVLDLHSDGQSLLHIYTHPIHQSLAEELAAQLRARVILLGADRNAYSFDDMLNLLWVDLAERFPTVPLVHGCFAATIELRGRIDVSDQWAKADAENIVHFLMRRGILAGDPGPLPEQPGSMVSPLTGLAHGRAPISGVATFRKKLGEWVEAGDVVADLLEPSAEDLTKARHPVTSPISGLLFSINLVRFIRAGQTFFKIAGREPLKDTHEDLLED